MHMEKGCQSKKKIAIASEVDRKTTVIGDSTFNYYLKSHNHIHTRLIRKTIELLSDNLQYNGLYN